MTQDPDTAIVLCDNVKGLGITLDPSHYVYGPHARENYEHIMKYVYHVRLRDTNKNAIAGPRRPRRTGIRPPGKPTPQGSLRSGPVRRHFPPARRRSSRRNAQNAPSSWKACSRIRASNKMTCATACLQAVLLELPEKHCFVSRARPMVGRSTHPWFPCSAWQPAFPGSRVPRGNLRSTAHCSLPTFKTSLAQPRRRFGKTNLLAPPDQSRRKAYVPTRRQNRPE